MPVHAIVDCHGTLQATRPYPAGAERKRRDRCPARLRGQRLRSRLVELFIAGLQMTAMPVVTSETEADNAWIEREGLVALQDIAGAHREEQTLYEIAQALGSNLGVADSMALIQDKVSRLVPLRHLRAVLGDDGWLRVPLRARARHRSALQVDPRSWSEVTPPAAVVRRRAQRARGGADIAATLPVDLRGTADRRSRFITPPRGSSPTSTAAARPRGRAGGGGHLQLGTVRADTARVAYRPADRSRQPALLDRQFETGLAHATRTNGSVSVVVLDLDRLKANDTYGHEAGDRALRW